MYDLGQREDQSDNLLTRLASLIPGYGGYYQRERRREADRLIRAHLAVQLESEGDRLGRVLSDLADAARLDDIRSVERLRLHTQRLVDLLRNVSAGYSGLFDAVQVDRRALDALCEFDAAMAADVDAIRSKVDPLVAAVAAGRELPVSDVRSALEAFEERFDRRDGVILRGEGPLSAEPSIPGFEPDRPLAGSLNRLRPGDVVSHGNTDYLVGARMDYSRGTDRWQAFLLQDAGGDRWLTVDPLRLLLLSREPSPIVGEIGAAAISIGGLVFTLIDQGQASVALDSPAKQAAGLNVAFWRYVAADGDNLWIERWRDGTNVFRGPAVSSIELQVRQR